MSTHLISGLHIYTTNAAARGGAIVAHFTPKRLHYFMIRVLKISTLNYTNTNKFGVYLFIIYLNERPQGLKDNRVIQYYF